MENPESQELEVVLANEGFYRAFESLNIREMEQVWATDRAVKCVHPGWELRSGWPDVRDSWVSIFNNTRKIKFEVSQVDTVINQAFAWVTCTEHVTAVMDGEAQTFQILATNLYLKRESRWLMVHHHGSPVLGRLPVEKGPA